MAPNRTGWVRGLTRRSLHRIAFTDWGPSSAARPVLCVQGLTRNGRDFDHLAAALACSLSWRPWLASIVREHGRTIPSRSSTF